MKNLNTNIIEILVDANGYPVRYQKDAYDSMYESGYENTKKGGTAEE